MARNHTPVLSEIWEPNYTLGEHRSNIGTPRICFRVQIRCSVSKRGRYRANYGRKSRPNFGLFHSL